MEGGDDGGIILIFNIFLQIFKYYPGLSVNAFDAHLDLCEAEELGIRVLAIRGLPLFCKDTPEHLSKIVDILAQLLTAEENVERDAVHKALLSLLRQDVQDCSWHGVGWLGQGDWVVQRSNIASDGMCCACREQLVCVDIDRAETDKFAQSIASLAMERELQSNFKEFQDWLDQHSEYETVVDGANIGLYQQNFAEGGFSIAQLDAVVKEVHNKTKKWPLVVLHKKRICSLFEDASKRELIEEWMDQGVLYETPYASNDDWYWLYASVKLQFLLVTNDEMRDHIFELLGSNFFFRWKERHQLWNCCNCTIFSPSRF